VGWDNATAESFFWALKNEMYYQRSFADRASARSAVAEYIEVSACAGSGSWKALLGLGRG
jgi:hypothetical protein